MKGPLVFIALVLAFLLSGCGLRESQKRIRSLSEEDCRVLVAKVKSLCEATAPPKKDDDRSWLRGADIPGSLGYLRPRRVYLTDSSATIELWHGGAGDDTIYVIRDDQGVWAVSVHEGDLLTKDRLIWTSRK